MKFTRQQLLLVGGALAGSGLMALMLTHASRSDAARSVVTIGDMRTIHAGVQVAGHSVLGDSRLSEGDAIVTGPDGRARIRLDDGTLVVVDASTEVHLGASGLSLEHGRLYVQGGLATKTQVSLGNLATSVSSSAAAFEKRDKTQIYCAQGELAVSQGSSQEHVALGETLSVVQGVAKVAPEAAFDDWTGGLAVPWSGEEDVGSAMPELRATTEESGNPLAVRKEALNVTIDGEVARTRTTTTYFNGSESSVDAEVRLRLPRGAILSSVTQQYEDAPKVDGSLMLTSTSPKPLNAGRLEWAGAGWLRGMLPGIPAGKTVELSLEYLEWLPLRAQRTTYRFPLAQAEQSPLVTELEARVDASRSGTPWLSASSGARVVSERIVELTKSDLRPTGDLVVELQPSVAKPGRARVYVQPAGKEDPYVLVRTEVPEVPDPSVRLALVVDTSMSVGTAGLETERAVVESILQGLGAHDALVVLAADQTVRALGSGVPEPMTAALREKLEQQLSELRPGGASNLGSALERAADVLDGSEPGQAGGMVVYVGDGRPTVGEVAARELRHRLARRASGIPRLGAVSVGLAADRWLLAELVAGSGPIYQVADRADAARVGAALLSEAVEPTLRDVELDLGSTIDRVYPREAHAALAGSTVTVTGRLRGALPDHIGFRFRKGTTLVQESRPLDAMGVPFGSDLPRRWATARIEETVARGDGIAPAVALAQTAGLLTPWTSWFFPGNGESGASVTPELRILELSPSSDAPFAAELGAKLKPQSTLLEPEPSASSGGALDTAAAAAAGRSIGDASDALRACRDARAAIRPDTASALSIELTVDPKGHATNVRVSPEGSSADAVLERCVKGVLESIAFFDAGSPVKVSRRVQLPPPRSTRRTQCSPASKLPLALRRSIWQRRDLNAKLDYSAAARSCELPAWRDRRALLDLLLLGKTSQQAMQLAQTLGEAGESDAQRFLKDEALRRVSSNDDLQALRRILLLEEPNIDAELEKAYRAARDDDARLAVVRRFLRLAPHSGLGRRRLFDLLESMGQRELLIAEIGRARQDPFADAGLLAAGASALRRVGLDDEGRRAFGELLERAPGDPWTLAYVGDRLRAEGLFDEAVAAYDSLAHIMPDDPSVALRLALAHAGTGRLDVATRLLEHVAQSGGRGDDGRLGELASITQGVLLAGARSQPNPRDVSAELLRRLTQTALPDVASLIVVRAAPSDIPLEIRVARERGGRDEEPADLDASALGLSAIRIERGDGSAHLRLRRPAEAGPSRPTKVSIAVLVLAEDRAQTRLVTRDVDLAGDGKTLELNWNGEALL